MIELFDRLITYMMGLIFPFIFSILSDEKASNISNLAIKLFDLTIRSPI